MSRPFRPFRKELLRASCGYRHGEVGVCRGGRAAGHTGTSRQGMPPTVCSRVGAKGGGGKAARIRFGLGDTSKQCV